jgi:catechol 2,3-dioxygenase-like lactoylglutathione lyase family enzyme
MMLDAFPIRAPAAAVDLERARRWYEDKLGLRELRTVDRLADFGSAKVAWFQDSEGNTYELSEVMAG